MPKIACKESGFYTCEADAEYFWSRVQKTDGCWEWQATRQRGYGIVCRHNRLYRANRIAYLLAKGDPGDLCVCHTCDNPPCCNPDHLFLGTMADNTQDMVRKGRWGRRSKKIDIPRMLELHADGLSRAEMAAIFNCTPGSIANALKRAVTPSSQDTNQ